jgi:Flp pilus assembly protein CpaB
MHIKIILMGVAAACVMVIGIYLVAGSFMHMQTTSQFVDAFPEATTSTPVDVSEVSLPPKLILAAAGKTFSAVPLTESQSSDELADGFFALTDDAAVYDIFYNEPTGILFISLYQEPISFSRALAERKLLETIQLTKEEICTIPIKVTTNAHVNPTFDGVNLGLSFCPGSVQLP